MTVANGILDADALFDIGVPVVVIDGLDLTGATDEAATILAALNTYGSVRLPSMDVTGGEFVLISDFTIPSGCRLYGAGKPIYDRVSAWIGKGSLLKGGRISVSSSRDVILSDFGLDNYASGNNGISGTTDATQDIIVRRVATRANNHGQLWEKNANTGVAATDRVGANVNNILIEDCDHYGGPNGFAVKMNKVTLRRCVAYDVTVQAYPIVSDNVNAAGTYSRASNVLLQDCDGINCGCVLRVYSRDAHSASPANTNNVQGAKDITWRGGRLSGATSIQGAFIGDDTGINAAQTPVNNINVVIRDTVVENNTESGIRYRYCTGGAVDNVSFASNGGNVGLQYSTDGRVTNLSKSNLRVSGTLAGQEGLVDLTTPAVSRTVYSAETDVTLTNQGATGAITYTLDENFPIGSEVQFDVLAAQELRVASSNVLVLIRNGAVTTGTYLTANDVGDTMRVKRVSATRWHAIASTGTWTAV